MARQRPQLPASTDDGSVLNEEGDGRSDGQTVEDHHTEGTHKDGSRHSSTACPSHPSHLPAHTRKIFNMTQKCNEERQERRRKFTFRSPEKINSLQMTTISRVMHTTSWCAKNFLTSLQPQARIFFGPTECTECTGSLLEVACQADIAFSRPDNSPWPAR